MPPGTGYSEFGLILEEVDDQYELGDHLISHASHMWNHELEKGGADLFGSVEYRLLEKIAGAGLASVALISKPFREMAVGGKKRVDIEDGGDYYSLIYESNDNQRIRVTRPGLEYPIEEHPKNSGLAEDLESIVEELEE